MLTQEEIYQYSLARDEDALRPLLDGAINNDELLPPIQQLVYDNEHDSAIWLLNKLPFDVHGQIIRIIIEDVLSKNLLGHAENIRVRDNIRTENMILMALLANHLDYAASLITRFHVNIDTINVIAFNTITDGAIEATEWLRINYGADVTNIVLGAIQRGLFHYAETLRIEHHADINKMIYEAYRLPTRASRYYAIQLLELPDADVNIVIMFLAGTGYGELAQNLYHRAPTLNYTDVAVAAIRGGDLDFSETIRFGYRHRIDLNEMIITAFEQGFIVYGQFLLNTPDFHVNINHIAKLAARKGLQHATHFLLLLFPMINVHEIAYAAAQAGQRAYAEWLLHEHDADASTIAAGAAQGGHREYAEWVRDMHNADPSVIAAGAAQGGHREYAEWLRTEHDANPFAIAKGAIIGGKFSYAEELIVSYPEDMDMIRIIATAIVNRHEQSPNFIRRLLLRHLSSLPDETASWGFIDSLDDALEQQGSSYSSTPEQRTQLVIQSRNIYNFKKRYGFSFEQALHWSKVGKGYLAILLATDDDYRKLRFPNPKAYTRLLRHNYPKQTLFCTTQTDNDMIKKIMSYWQKRRIITVITDYCDRHLPGGVISSVSRFFSLAQQVSEATYIARKQAALALLERSTSREELVELINNELTLYREEKGYEPDYVDEDDEYLSYLLRVASLLDPELANDNGAAAPRINPEEVEATTHSVGMV